MEDLDPTKANRGKIIILLDLFLHPFNKSLMPLIFLDFFLHSVRLCALANHVFYLLARSVLIRVLLRGECTNARWMRRRLSKRLRSLLVEILEYLLLRFHLRLCIEV